MMERAVGYTIIGIAAAAWIGFVPILAQPEEPVPGKVTYEKHCLSCHGAKGKGDGLVGKVLRPPATDFTTSASKKKTDAELMAIIEQGVKGTAMSGWKNSLSGEEMKDVLVYIRTFGS